MCINNTRTFFQIHSHTIKFRTNNQFSVIRIITDNGNLVIEHCVNQGDIGGMTNAFSAGGMVGQGSFIIRNCHNYGKVSSETTAGGMVGQGGSFGLIECCINHTTGEVMGGCSAGGIIGTPIFTTIRMCGNRALVTGKGNSAILVGGIAGSDGSFSNCYNTGDLKAVATSSDAIIEMGGITGSPTEGFVYNVYNSGQIIKPTNPNLLSEIYGHVIPAIMSDTAIRNCYWYGNEEIPIHVYNLEGHNYVELPGSCVFNEGPTSTSWILNEAQYGTIDLVKALNHGAMGECVWLEDEDNVNGGFPVIGLRDPDKVNETAENQFPFLGACHIKHLGGYFFLGLFPQSCIEWKSYGRFFRIDICKDILTGFFDKLY